MNTVVDNIQCGRGIRSRNGARGTFGISNRPLRAGRLSLGRVSIAKSPPVRRFPGHAGASRFCLAALAPPPPQGSINLISGCLVPPEQARTLRALILSLKGVESDLIVVSELASDEPVSCQSSRLP